MAKPNKKPEAAPPFEIPDWPASRVEMWALAKIKPYEKNPRVHSPEQISLLAASMREEGVTTYDGLYSGEWKHPNVSGG